jgi:hypothetical protein
LNFYPYASVEVPRAANGLIAADKNSMNDFWLSLNGDLGDELSESIGCYVFSIRAGKGLLPWYVGMAEKQSFRQECFTSHKLNYYNNAVAGKKGTPLLTLVVKHTPGNKAIRPTGSEHRDIQFLETMLIANCVGRNSELFNVRDTKMLRDMCVPGLLNTPPGKPAAAVSDFKKLVGG